MKSYCVHLEAANYDWEGFIEAESFNQAAENMATDFISGVDMTSDVVYIEPDNENGRGYHLIDVSSRRGPVKEIVRLIVCLVEEEVE